MHALVTGARGTVGRALTSQLEGGGARVTRWDRTAVPIDRYEPMEQFVRETKPDVIFHLAIASASTGREREGWLVNYEWTSELAWIAKMSGVCFVFTSTALVFSSRAVGPFTPSTPPDAEEGYGHEKRRAEERVLHQNAEARIVRLGWQIAEELGSNNMWDHLSRSARENGRARASSRFLPACSFVDDTARALVDIVGSPPGTYMLDQNEKWSLFDIAKALAARSGRPFDVERHDDFAQDQRMLDPRLALPSLRTRLPSLP